MIMVHEQVAKQLEHLKSIVDAEIEREKNCSKWGIIYTESRTKYEAIDNYEEYKKEIEKNGDKNLLVMTRMSRDDGINMWGVYPFARRYVNEPYLVYRTAKGGEILTKEY